MKSFWIDMMYDILILTDHSTHSDENSVYALAGALAAHRHIHSVDIASRGTPDNEPFFAGDMRAMISVIPGIAGLTFRKARTLFETSTTEAELDDYDFIFLRLPPPVSDVFFRALTDYIPEDHIINSPSGIVRTSVKSFLTSLPDLCPGCGTVHSPEETLAFLRVHPVVLKPEHGYGGVGIYKLTDTFAEDGEGRRYSHEAFFRQWHPPYFVMPFLERVHEGDKRTIVVNGKVLGSSLRFPAKDHWICNIAQGGTSCHSTADEEELKIAQRLSERLSRCGVILFGFDTLVGNDGRRVLSEINTMSIGGLMQTRDVHGSPILPQVSRELLSYMDKIWYQTLPTG